MPVTFNRVRVRIQVKGVYEPKENGGPSRRHLVKRLPRLLDKIKSLEPL
jgi:hypothetical protein